MPKFRLSQILHLCTQKSVCATNFGPFGEISANFSVQLSSRSHFANIENKKVIAENQCEQGNFDEFISPDEGLLRETCKSQNINPILSSP